MFVIKLPFVQDKVCEVFDGILMLISHEGFNARLWKFEFAQLVNGVFPLDLVHNIPTILYEAIKTRGLQLDWFLGATTCVFVPIIPTYQENGIYCRMYHGLSHIFTT